MKPYLHTDDGSARLTLANDYNQLPRLAVWIADFSAFHQLSCQTSFRLELILTEAATNIMDHAAAHGSPIEISCLFDSGTVTLELSDEGPPFDPTETEQITLPKTLEDAEPGGLGIHLIRSYADTIRYRREHGRNVLTILLRD